MYVSLVIFHWSISNSLYIPGFILASISAGFGDGGGLGVNGGVGCRVGCRAFMQGMNTSVRDGCFTAAPSKAAALQLKN